jgi:hypothetical protein
MTEYVVLIEENGMWREYGKAATRSARAAVIAALQGTPGYEGRYVAVPARSFHPLTVTVKTETKITVE